MRTVRRNEQPPALELGQTAAGHPFVLPLGWHGLVAGLSGSGKSTTIRAALTAAAHLQSLAVVLVDVKRVESRPWRPRASAVAVTVPDALDTLAALVAAMDARYELMDALGAVMWSTRFGPRVLLVVDELAGIVATGERTDKRAVALLRQLLERGRACGYTLLLSTQRPSADVIPTSLRDLCALRIAHATANVESTRMILADAAELGPAHRLPIDDRHRGQAWAVVDGERVPQLVRAYYVTPEQAGAVAQRTARLAVPWPALVPVDADVPRTEAIARPSVAVNLAGPDRHEPARTTVAVLPSRPQEPWTAPTGAPVPFRPAQAPTAPLVDDLGEDAATLLDALRSRPVPTADLPAVTSLPEGRCRRARQALANAGRIRNTPHGWTLA